MQGRQLFAQDVEGRDADRQMLADRTLVEGGRGAGQLDFAMQGLVGHTEERAVWHAQPVALRRQRAALHVHRDGAGEIDAQPFLREP
jgi:ureidoglycolate hydrolase